MRTNAARVVWTLLICWLGSRLYADAPSDEMIARYAAIVGTNRLARDLDDKKGHALIELAGFLTPANKTVILTKAMLKRNMKPDPITTKMTEAKLVKGICRRAEDLLNEVYPTNAEAGRVALAYLRVADLFDPKCHDTILGLMLLRADGLDQKPEELWQAGVKLKAAVRKGRRKLPRPELKATRTDLKLARFAAQLGTLRLAENSNDVVGIALVRLGAWVDPQNRDALLALGLLERNLKPVARECPVSEAKLTEVLIRRGTQLADARYAKDDDAVRMAKVYLYVAEKLSPRNKDVILQLALLEKRGHKEGLDALLNTRRIPVAATAEPEPDNVAQVDPDAADPEDAKPADPRRAKLRKDLELLLEADMRKLDTEKGEWEDSSPRRRHAHIIEGSDPPKLHHQGGVAFDNSRGNQENAKITSLKGKMSPDVFEDDFTITIAFSVRAWAYRKNLWPQYSVGMLIGKPLWPSVGCLNAILDQLGGSLVRLRRGAQGRCDIVYPW